MEDLREKTTDVAQSHSSTLQQQQQDKHLLVDIQGGPKSKLLHFVHIFAKY